MAEGTELSDIDKVKVRDIHFAYNNHKVINLLTKRGSAITYCQWEEVKNID